MIKVVISESSFRILGSARVFDDSNKRRVDCYWPWEWQHGHSDVFDSSVSLRLTTPISQSMHAAMLETALIFEVHAHGSPLLSSNPPVGMFVFVLPGRRLI